MSLDPGTRLGSFEVLGPLGAGGMGEVYRANDTRLRREVAIKILPEAFAQDPVRLARFEREARLLASLNHPGLAAIYGLEQAGPVRYIVMELIPGQTLAEKLASGALAIPEALDLARQIAEALGAAHEKGIVHRDLKPSNIKVTPDGKAKVLDLGLAKAMDPKPEDSDTSKSPTVVLEQTRSGVILGTAEFMSPEQARGKPTDKRTDIWAYGCILFEMLSGRRAFSGETVSDAIAAILTREPDWTRLPRETPSHVRDLLGRCLEKDPNRRLRDIGDARLDLDAELSPASGAAPIAKPFRPRARGALIGAVLAAFLAAGVWVGVQLLGRSNRARAPDSKYLVVLPFKDLSGTTQGQLLGDGFVETVSARLNQVPGVQVVTPAASIAASDRQKDPLQVARSVGANLILRCTIQREGARTRITYSVLSASNGVQLTGDQVTGSSSDLFGLQDELTEKVSTSLNLASRTKRTAVPSGLETPSQQERYIEAVGLLQRYDRAASVEQAIRLLEPLAAERPSSALVSAALGRAYLYEFNLTRQRPWADKAAAAVERARQLAPDLPEVDATLGELLMRTGKAPDAIAPFRRALSLQPNNYDALLGLARAYDGARDPVSAEATYRRAIGFQPGYWAGYSKLAGHYYARGQYEQAAATLERVTKLSPDNSRAFSNLGATYELLGKFDRASDAYRRAITIEPTHLGYSNLGTLQFFQGQYRESANSFRKAVELTPTHPELWANLGDALARLPGQEAQSRIAYGRCAALADDQLRVNPRDALIHSKYAVCLARTGKQAEALRHANEALGIEPKNPEWMYDAAVVENCGGRRSEALSWISRAVAAGASKVHLARDPAFENLRGDKAFLDAIR